MLSEHTKEINRRSYARNLEKRRTEARERAQKNKNEINQQRRTAYSYNPNVYRQRQQEKNALIRSHVIMQYGGKCTCCGETKLDFLDLDHVNNDGKKHRQELGFSGGIAICRWAMRNAFPKSVQILCSNCNQGKRRNGGICPHESPDQAFDRETASPAARAALSRLLKSIELGCDPRLGLPGTVTYHSKRFKSVSA